MNAEQTVLRKKNTPRDVFLHLFSMLALYWSATAFITLCWQYANYFFPDVSVVQYGGQPWLGPIRFSVASLVIMFPLFLLSSWFLHRIYRKEAEVRDSRIRKWLVYLTLFIAAIIIVIDLVAVIYNFLGGDVTAKFLLKSANVLLVAAAVFGYYLQDIRQKAAPREASRGAAIASVVVVLIAVVSAFFIVGSPWSARQAAFDRQRVNDLQGIQYQIINYWQKKAELPAQLSDLNDSISGYAVPADPETGASYQYILKDPTGLSFQLCTMFDLKSGQYGAGPQSMPVYPPGSFSDWTHSAGITCFDRQIDQQLYPPISK